MSHQEKIERINAALNTSESWARRWQVEREHNERLAAEAEKVRAGILGMRQRANERYLQNQKYSAERHAAGDSRMADTYGRICTAQFAMVRAFDDVLQLMDTASTDP